MTQGTQLPLQQEGLSHSSLQKTCYYVLFSISLVFDIALATLYALQVYSEHTDCLVNEHNVTLHLELAFRLGLSSMLVEFLTLTCVLIPLYSSQDPTLNHPGRLKVTKSCECSLVDWTVKLLVMIAAAIQLMVT